MTMTPFTCETFAEHLADYLEHDSDAATRSAMEAHAAGCAECGPLLADLAELRVQAASLPALAPSRDLWGGIAGRIEAPVVEIASAVGRRPTAATALRIQRSRWWKHPALLAAGLVGITAGVTHYLTREAYEGSTAPQRVVAAVPTVIEGGAIVEANVPTQVAEAGDASSGAPVSGGSVPVTSPSGRSASGGESPQPERDLRTTSATPSATPVRTVSAGAADAGRPTADVYRPGELAALDSLYQREILRLREILGQRRTQLDTATVTVLERNMTVIDRAIAECRAALAADPASRFLNQQLNEALESKIELLRTAATMPIGS